MKTLVDYREKKILPCIEDLISPYELVNLPVGDFLIIFEDYGVLVERKTARDFLNSMKTNRLWEQMHRFLAEKVMGYQVRRRALLIHGYLDDEIGLSGFGWNHNGCLYGNPIQVQHSHFSR